MTIVALDNYRSIKPTISSESLKKNWLLPKEKLEEIARLIKPLYSQFVFNYLEIKEEQLPDLQEYCFKTVFEMCEQKMWPSLQKICHVIQGLTDSSGNTILANYVQRDDVQKVKAIVDARLTQTLSKGSTPLHVAVKMGKSASAVKTLLEDGCAKLIDQDCKGRLAIHIAVKEKRLDIIEILIPKNRVGVGVYIPYYSKKQNLDLDPLALTVLKGQIVCFDEVNRVGKVPLNSVRVGTESMTLLHLAVYSGQFELLQHLLTVYFQETKSLLNVTNRQGYTPLILAVILCDVTALQLLIEKGASVHCCDYKGWTAMHHAVYKKQLHAVRILAAYGANFSAIDFCGNTPLGILGEEELAFKNSIINAINDHDYKEHAYQVNFALNPPENLVFKGGGPKGITYLGAIKELERRDLFVHVKRIAGTSAGAITAALLAVGCSSQEAEKLLIDTSGTYFLDHPFTEERLKEFVKDNLGIPGLGFLKEIYDTVSESITNISPAPVLKHIGLKYLSGIWKYPGICAGKKFLNWIEREITQRTSIPHCTFGELADLIAKGKKNLRGSKYKHLHVYSTRLSGPATELVRFSSEDPTYKNLIISEAVRASMSIPVVFKPHVLIFKQKIADGEYEYYTSNRTYVSRDYATLVESLRVGNHIAEPSHIDGGLIYNFPIKAFDRRGYVQPGTLEEEREYYQFNRKTLGFSLYSAEKERVKVNKVEAIETIGDLLMAVYSVFRHAESLLDKMDCDPRDKKRVIALDNQEISFLGFNTTPMVGKGAKAVDDAEKKTREFFDKQEREVDSLISAQIKQAVKRDSNLEKPINQPEWQISEAAAKNLLTLGPKAHDYLYWCKAGLVLDTAMLSVGSIAIITIPITIPMLIFRHHESKSLKSRKLELLAFDDTRFIFFKHLGDGEFQEAYAEFIKNQAFFNALMKTYVFVSTLKKCLINCDNKYYHCDSNYNDVLRFKRYMYFFEKTKIIPSIIPHEFVYDLPEL